MALLYEVVHWVDGHLFDAESYELTSVRGRFAHCESGYYAVVRTTGGYEWRDDAVLESVGPFASAAYAMSALRDLQSAGVAVKRGPHRLVEATAARDLEAIA